MVKPEILSEKPIHMYELKEEIENIKKNTKELGFRSQKTEDYLNHFSSIDKKKAEELKSKLEALKISRLKEEFIIKILDTMPKSIDELKTLLQGYVISINNEDSKKIIDVVKEFITAKK